MATKTITRKRGLETESIIEPIVKFRPVVNHSMYPVKITKGYGPDFDYPKCENPFELDNGLHYEPYNIKLEGKSVILFSRKFESIITNFPYAKAEPHKHPDIIVDEGVASYVPLWFAGKILVPDRTYRGRPVAKSEPTSKLLIYRL